MNVKSIDIARALGISKSTVSLALNGKPGVSEQTRQEVLACKKQLEEHGVVPPGMFSRQPEQRKRQQIKIVKITNGMKNIQGAELDLWTDVNQVFEKSCRKQNSRENAFLFHRKLRPMKQKSAPQISPA